MDTEDFESFFCRNQYLNLTLMLQQSSSGKFEQVNFALLDQLFKILNRSIAQHYFKN